MERARESDIQPVEISHRDSEARRLLQAFDWARTPLGPMDAWPHTEMARFQRAISLALIVLAGILIAVEAGRQPTPLLQMVFGGATLPCLLLARREALGLRAVRTALSG